jgi:hypothetical protein
MSRAHQHKLQTEADSREVDLSSGRTLVVRDQGEVQLVEIRAESGTVEVRIALTEQGPVLQMESVRLAIKATEAVEIDSPRVAIRGEQAVEISGGKLVLRAEDDVTVDADGEVRLVGKMIYLN